MPPRHLPVSLQEDVPLASRTTIGVGGPARFLASCRGPRDVASCLEWAADQHLEVFVLGGGSNLLVADQGFAGLVIRLEYSEVTLSTGPSGAHIQAGAGAEWDALTARAVRENLAGIECLGGIPGTVGAAPIQNIGAYGQEVAETIDWLQVIDRHDGRTRHVTAADCRFGYRTSAFKTSWHDRFVIVRVAFRLRPRGEPTVRYDELARRLEQACPGRKPTLADVREAVLSIRASKSMLYDPADPDGRSAGSFFTNPVVSPAVARRVRDMAARGARTGRPVPQFPASNGKIKLSAGWLIEEAGFPRGFRQGRVALSSKHALAIVNPGGATAAEIVELASSIRQAVLERFGVSLVPEPRLLGFDSGVLQRLGILA